MYKTEWRLTCNWNGSPRWMIKMLIWPYPPLEHEWAIHNQDYADMFRDVMEIWIQFQDLLVVLRIQGYLKMTIIKKYNGIEETVVLQFFVCHSTRFLGSEKTNGWYITLNLSPSENESRYSLCRRSCYRFICMKMNGCYMARASHWLRCASFTLKSTIHG